MKRTLTLFFISVFAVSLCISQESLKHEKKVYKSPDGRLYMQKDLPVYLRMATSPDNNAQTFLLESEETKAYANPMYLDTEGYNTFRAPWCVDTVTKKPVYPQQDIIFEVYADSKAPVTRLSFGNASTYKKDGKIYVNGELEITLKAIDQLSGVENIYYSIDAAAYSSYSNPVKLNEEREYEIKFYAIDNVGNVEKIQIYNIVIDKTNPKTSYNIIGDNFENIVSARSRIELKAEDNGIGIENTYYQIDGGKLITYSKPISTAGFQQGEHKMTFYSVDKVKNKEPENVFDFYVDKTPPTIVEEIDGKKFFANGKEYFSGKAMLKITSFDNKAGVKEVYYSVNNSEYDKYEKPVVLSQNSGNYSIRSYAIDNVNNKSTVESSNEQSSGIPYIDLTGPSLSYSFTGSIFVTRDTTFINKETKILLKATDSESGINTLEYSINGESPLAYDKPFSIEKEGVQKISITGYDNVDNTSSKDFFVFIDNTGPEIFHKFSTSTLGKENIENTVLNVYPLHTVVFLSATDKVVGFDNMMYKLNDGYNKSYTNFIGTFQQKGINKIKVIAKDKLGNITETEIDFFIK